MVTRRSSSDGKLRPFKWPSMESIIDIPDAHGSDEVFGFCKFSHDALNNEVIYVTAMRDRGGSIVKWNTTTWKRISSKYVVKDPISAFTMSDDGIFLAM
ncbi:hypothetical protein L2E82_40344 [Cichorium intybus]|uniref:Uncharacterized protein n=1 Tax=Cichorium intybus TaxID=13427 RepID=A0ACB9AM43_CICIN|nr:hypothetical protein L2E82_40344 [Cichorium intybus]